jgi:dTDP-4-amino-4,6-dideoxygalactose transaminase
LALPAKEVTGERHVYHIFAVRVPHRDRVAEQMRAADVGVGVHYPIPVHLQPAFQHLGYRVGDFPVSEALARETLSLPLFAEISTLQIDKVSSALLRACAVAEAGA